jgi:TnsA endonuclease N terminal
MNLLELTKQFTQEPIVIDLNPLRSVGGKQSAPHLRTTALNLGWLDCDWINTESSLEADFVLVTSMNPKVSAIYHQRVRITLPNGSKYIPDFLVIEDGIPKIVEVKPHEFAQQPKWVEKLALAKDICAHAGLHFELATELDFRAGNIHQRAEYIAYCANLKFKQEDIDLAIATVSQHVGGLTIKEFRNITKLTKLIVLHLAAWRKVSLAADLQYEDDSIVC